MKSLHFSVDGEFITERARELYATEGCRKAYRFLSAAFPKMNKQLKNKICSGKLKMVGVDVLTLEKDNSKISLSGESLKNPKIKTNRKPRSLNKPRSIRKSSIDAAILKLQICNAANEGILKSGRSVMVEPRMLDHLDIKELKELADCIPAQTDKSLFKEVPKLPKPKPDLSLKSIAGWIRPDGKLFPCSHFEHIQLAYALGFEGYDIEKTWVKFQKVHCYDCFFRPTRGITQSQLNTMDRLCAIHNIKLPDTIDNWMK